ncbi:hypothetical protein OHW08_18040 [Acinetobacter baumannii]|nr:hypothetical protein [Acinetobacter baumannii]MDC4912609.1 hypothetical protein [Acinetobacter baumannii]MDC4930813.1 hypothetical protein [Acinetobacter baumannii]MDC4970279.1 hypothetical protein [Acinetobacter baumannii]MDC5009182.1 hypothetical protein [Acinetobacter baumannii]
MINVPVVEPSLPAASVAVTRIVCDPSFKAGSVLSASVHVPSPLFTAVYSTPSTVTITFAVGSSTVPVNVGVLS